MHTRRITTLVLALAFFVLGAPARAALFSAADNGFTIDLPSAWQKAPLQNDEVLSLRKGASTIKFSPLPNCKDFACIEEETTKALAYVKSRKFRILENTYSGEIIKKTEFSTHDPLLSFNYSAANVDFTTAYFLSGGQGYYIGIKGIAYVEADLILSFISPLPKPTDASQVFAPDTSFEVADISAQDIVAAPIATPLEPAQPAAAQPQEQAQAAAPSLSPARLFCILIALYIFAMLAAPVLRLAIHARPKNEVANPRSGYPVKGRRLYGSPDLFFKLHDNQGNNFIAVSSRWSGIFMGLGAGAAVLFFAFKTALGCAQAAGLIALHAVIINTIASFCTLLGAVGVLVFAAGALMGMIFPSKFYIYDDKGALALRAVQKGFFISREDYLLYPAGPKHAPILRLSRARFTLLRSWALYDAAGQLATVKETSLPRAVARRLLGHMGGFLRAHYQILGRMESKGALAPAPALATRFAASLDKPGAVDSTLVLAASVVIFMRDRDKWHPWIS